MMVKLILSGTSIVIYSHLCSVVAVYTQSLSHILEVVCGPIMQLLEEEVQRNKATIQKLKQQKEQLQAILSQETN